LRQGEPAAGQLDEVVAASEAEPAGPLGGFR